MPLLTPVLVSNAGHSINQSFANQIDTGQQGLARASLGIEKFIEIVFNREPIHISNVSVANVSSQEVVITWQTNHLSSSQVNFGNALGNYQQTLFSGNQTRNHSLTLTNLKPDTTYYYELISKNSDYAIDAFRSFTTGK